MAKRKGRLSMRKLQEILRLRETGLSNRQIAGSINISPSTVSLILSRAKAGGLSWPLPEDMDERAVNEILYPEGEKLGSKPLPDMRKMHQELKRKSVTLQLLWEEYRNEHPDGYRYSYFCDLYRAWQQKLDPPLRQTHKAGEKMFVDFAGQTVDIQDPNTGKTTPAYIFLAVLGASNYTFACGVLSQELENWIKLHCLALEYFGGIPEIIVPDNLKAGVTRPCRYEPDLNPTYQEMAEHYGCVVIPGRPRHPKDKSKAENAVLFVERQILARLRNRIFFSLKELNQCIFEELTVLNRKPFQKLDGSRRSWYESLEKPALRPLPPRHYEFARWKKLKVNIDYHVELEKNYYSVPYRLVREQVDVRFTASTVEIIYKGKRVASHARIYGKGKSSTHPEHMPSAHRKHLEWNPSRIINWAQKSGPATAQMVKELMGKRVHPEQAYRSCLGLLSLENKYGEDRLEAACSRALSCCAFSYRSVKNILKNGLDQLEPEKQEVLPLPAHENIRGAKYYEGEVVPC